MSTALVVDDSAVQRQMISGHIDDVFNTIETAADGVEAVDQYRKHDPDFVTMDINMPVKDGVEATAEITDIDSDAVVVMCTSVEQREMMVKAVKEGASEYITKPVEQAELLDTIKSTTSLYD